MFATRTTKLDGNVCACFGKYLAKYVSMCRSFGIVTEKGRRIVAQYTSSRATTLNTLNWELVSFPFSLHTYMYLCEPEMPFLLGSSQKNDSSISWENQ